MSSRIRNLLLIPCMLAFCVPLFAGVRLAGFGVGVGYSSYRVPYYGYGPYDPWGWRYPYYAPGFYLVPDPGRGEVKLTHLDKTAEIYINQAFAGIAGDLKTFYLDPGAYDLEVRMANKEPQQKRIYVLSGKTLKLSF